MLGRPVPSVTNQRPQPCAPFIVSSQSPYIYPPLGSDHILSHSWSSLDLFYLFSFLLWHLRSINHQIESLLVNQPKSIPFLITISPSNYSHDDRLADRKRILTCSPSQLPTYKQNGCQSVDECCHTCRYIRRCY
jgi:hypothetical protein